MSEKIGWPVSENSVPESRENAIKSAPKRDRMQRGGRDEREYVHVPILSSCVDRVTSSGSPCAAQDFMRVLTVIDGVVYRAHDTLRARQLEDLALRSEFDLRCPKELRTYMCAGLPLGDDDAPSSSAVAASTGLLQCTGDPLREGMRVATKASARYRAAVHKLVLQWLQIQDELHEISAELYMRALSRKVIRSDAWKAFARTECLTAMKVVKPPYRSVGVLLLVRGSAHEVTARLSVSGNRVLNARYATEPSDTDPRTFRSVTLGDGNRDILEAIRGTRAFQYTNGALFVPTSLFNAIVIHENSARMWTDVAPPPAPPHKACT